MRKRCGMRLIDADVLLEHIKKLECHAENKKYEQGLNDCLQFYFPQIIDKQPTAYDIEKVVAELEEMQVKAEKDMQLSDNVAEANAYGGMMLAYGLAIPIVEKGGVE